MDEECNLQIILQRKIGQEDVGQKGNRFATQLSENQTANVPRPRPPPQAPVPLVPAMANVNNDAGALDDDDDDEMLMLAASQVEVEQSQPATVSQRNASENSSRGKDPSRNAGPPDSIAMLESLIIKEILNVGINDMEKIRVEVEAFSAF